MVVDDVGNWGVWSAEAEVGGNALITVICATGIARRSSPIGRITAPLFEGSTRPLLEYIPRLGSVRNLLPNWARAPKANQLHALSAAAARVAAVISVLEN